MHDPRISALLRLKRYEQPPEGYFDQLLEDVHRRQREELLRRPLWKIALERVQVCFGEHSMGGLSYAGAMAALLVAGVAAIGLLTPGELGQREDRPAIAKVEPPAPEKAVGNRMLITGPQNVSLAPREEVASTISAPRYIIDARPVSYEPASRF
jgi:hypothetical protein